MHKSKLLCLHWLFCHMQKVTSLRCPVNTPWHTSRLCINAVLAELVGVLLFALLGGTAPGSYAPWANGFALAVLIYITANISGGHLNPAVTIATLLTGHITIAKGITYILAQCVGGILGCLLQVRICIAWTKPVHAASLQDRGVTALQGSA